MRAELQTTLSVPLVHPSIVELVELALGVLVAEYFLCQAGARHEALAGHRIVPLLIPDFPFESPGRRLWPKAATNAGMLVDAEGLGHAHSLAL